ncbi:four helix bundle protein [Nostoc sp. LEGE 12447]|uniref:four helix bundle protein n=1 Tax=Nostoc sp. LEGE 12447 TaxID=1828640 RepID=UPI001883B904|nr:four helix bundle protein [Nostoc sp. LEGE 12447]MBE9003388.1 four helix bundle protein [Nostoc sp. LEGE 12447]
MSYKEQFILNRAVQLAIHCYKFTNLFSRSELYGLICQIMCSPVSVASNLAFGCRRRSRQEYIHL